MRAIEITVWGLAFARPPATPRSRFDEALANLRGGRWIIYRSSAPSPYPLPQTSRGKANRDHYVYDATAPGERECGKLSIVRP